MNTTETAPKKAIVQAATDGTGFLEFPHFMKTPTLYHDPLDLSLLCGAFGCDQIWSFRSRA
jgi:hypothetical protein